jgi:hypothetical protein
MRIAADTCVYTNSNFTWEVIRGGKQESGSAAQQQGDAAAKPPLQ